MIGCALCRPLLTPVIHESRHWRIALNRNQDLLGKLIVVLRRHEEAVVAVSAAEWADLQREVVWATKRLADAFAPDHFNYAFLQNQDRHVHLHLIPRYATARSVDGRQFTDPAYPAHYRVSGPARAGDAVPYEAIRQALHE